MVVSHFRAILITMTIAAGVVAACGLDLVEAQTGEGTTNDASAAADDAGDEGTSTLQDGAPTCALDAACLGTIPAGWKPISLTDAGCGAGFEATTLVTNPTLGANGCMCGACQASGTIVCDGVTEVSGGNNCNDDPFL